MPDASPPTTVEHTSTSTNSIPKQAYVWRGPQAGWRPLSAQPGHSTPCGLTLGTGFAYLRKGRQTSDGIAHVERWEIEVGA